MPCILRVSWIWYKFKSFLCFKSTRALSLVVTVLWRQKCRMVSFFLAYFALPVPAVSSDALRGSTPQDSAQVLQWVSFADSEIIPPASAWVFPTLGIMQYNKQVCARTHSPAVCQLAVCFVLLLVTWNCPAGSKLCGVCMQHNLSCFSTKLCFQTDKMAQSCHVHKIVVSPEASQEFCALSSWLLLHGSSPCISELNYPYITAGFVHRDIWLDLAFLACSLSRLFYSTSKIESVHLTKISVHGTGRRLHILCNGICNLNDHRSSCTSDMWLWSLLKLVLVHDPQLPRFHYRMFA